MTGILSSENDENKEIVPGCPSLWRFILALPVVSPYESILFWDLHFSQNYIVNIEVKFLITLYKCLKRGKQQLMSSVLSGI